MLIFCQNLFYIEKLEKRTNDKSMKPWWYLLKEKVWFNSLYIKIKHNQNLEAKFFNSFKVLYSVKKQVYKLKLLAKLTIHNIFLMSLLELNTTKKG